MDLLADSKGEVVPPHTPHSAAEKYDCHCANAQLGQRAHSLLRGRRPGGCRSRRWLRRLGHRRWRSWVGRRAEISQGRAAFHTKRTTAERCSTVHAECRHKSDSSVKRLSVNACRISRTATGCLHWRTNVAVLEAGQGVLLAALPQLHTELCKDRDRFPFRLYTGGACTLPYS